MPTVQQIINSLTTGSIVHLDGTPSTINSWNGINILGQSLSIDYSIIGSLPSYYSTVNTSTQFDKTTVNPNGLLPDQVTAVNGATTAWSSFANISFTNAGFNKPNAVITIGQANFIGKELKDYALTYNGDIPNKTPAQVGDIWINSNTTASGIASQTQNQPRQVGYWSIVHEMGHAVGLEHPNQNGSSGDMLHTIMSYNIMDGIHATQNITYGGHNNGIPPTPCFTMFWQYKPCMVLT